MILITTILEIGGSFYVRIPAPAVGNYGLLKENTPIQCKIEDISKNELKIIF